MVQRNKYVAGPSRLREKRRPPLAASKWCPRQIVLNSTDSKRLGGGITVSGVSQRILTVLIAIALPIFSFGQPAKLRDRDPDLAGSKKILDELQQANFHFGSFYLMSRLRISDVGYEQGASIPTGDQTSSVSLNIEAPHRLYYRPHQKSVFTVEVIPGYTLFGKGGTNQFNYTARADAHFLFNHLYLDVYTIGLDQLKAHLSDINRLATVRERETGVGGEWKYSSRTSTLFNFSVADSEYPEKRFQPETIEGQPIPVQLLEREEANGRVAFHHKTFPKTSLMFSAEASTYEFKNARNKDSKRLWYGAGFFWNSGRAQIRAEAGPIRLEFDDATQKDYSGIAGNIAVSRSSGPWGYTAGLERDLGFSITRNNNYYIATTANAGITYQMSRRLTLRTNAVWEHDEFDVPVLGVLREDTISFYSVGFSYGIRRLRFGGDIGWYQRDSTLAEGRDAGIRYLAHLSITP